MKKITHLWTKIWMLVVFILVAIPSYWYIDTKYVQEKVILYEGPITFLFFLGLIVVALTIWGVGLFIKRKKSNKV